LIDLDGTIVDITVPCIKAAKEASSALGLQNLDDGIGLEIAKRLQSNLSLDDLFAKFEIDKNVGKHFIQVFLKAWYSIAPMETKLLPKVRTTLRDLSERFLLALITRRNMPKELVIKELERLQLNPFFKIIMTSQDVEAPKPSPLAFLRAANQLAVPINECAVIGDAIVDVQAGKSAGAKTIAVLSGLFSREELEKQKPDLIMKDINSLTDLLRANQDFNI
jgi:HAD superfamily hydrolase (TIGR01509 family)